MEEFDLIWLRTISEDARMIAYRPSFRHIAGSVTGAILLQQILYRWVRNDFQPFYKYKEPCDADGYRPGDSWCEELAFSREEFDGALKRIGQKVTAETGKDPNALVWYRIMADRKTWYEVNYVALRNVAFPLYQKRDSHVTKSGNPALPIYIETKNTTKNTTEREGARSDLNSVSSRQQPPAPPQTALPAKPPRLPNDGYEMPTANDPPPVVEPTPKQLQRWAPQVDPRKFVNGYIPAEKGATPVEVWYESFSVQEVQTRLTAPDQDDLRSCADLARLREVVATFRQCDFKRKRNIRLILDWYRDGIPDTYRRPGGGVPLVAPPPPATVLDFNWEDV